MGHGGSRLNFLFLGFAVGHNDNDGSAQPSHTGPGGREPKNTRAAEYAAARGAVSYAEAAVIFVGGVVYWLIPFTCDSLMAGRFAFGFWCWWALANLARCWRVYVERITSTISLLVYYFAMVISLWRPARRAQTAQSPAGRPVAVFACSKSRAPAQNRAHGRQRPNGRWASASWMT